MIGFTLFSYFSLHFLRYFFAIFLLFFALIVAVDLIELTRSATKVAGVSTFDLVQIAILRAPSFAQRVLPFAILFGATTSLLLLNRRLELVVARASSVSVWQFMAPYFIASLAIGVFASLVYNPLALTSLRASQATEAKVFGKVKGGFSNKSRNFWLRVGSKKGDVIIRAKVAQNNGLLLSAVSVYRFSESGKSLDRIDAEKARFKTGTDGQNFYTLSNAVLTRSGSLSVARKTFKIPVSISQSQLQVNTMRPDNVSFWNMTQQAARAEKAGRNPLPFATAFQSLTSRPLLFVAMVLLAACVSLRFTRFGQSGRLILGGVLGGFVLYVTSEVVLTFGSNGLVSPTMAAWSPACIATLIGTTVLLHQEDG